MKLEKAKRVVLVRSKCAPAKAEYGAPVGPPGGLVFCVIRPNLAATLAVGLFGKSFLSKPNSLFDHKPLTSFFFAIA